MARERAAGLAAALASALAWCAPAGAFTPPELFVRPQLAGIEHEPAGDWVPLASAPVFAYIGGYQVGYRLQASGERNELQRAALSFVAVPDGRPTQPHNTPPTCVTQIGTPGTIVTVGSEVQFEGVGQYTVSVSLGPGTGGPTDCLTGPTTTGLFGVDVSVTPQLVGEPLAFRAEPLPGDPFVGIRADPPAGGFLETSCARDATPQPDGSLGEGALYIDTTFIEDNFKTPGNWSCVTRGWVEGVDDEFETIRFGTPWSAPLAVLVRSDFRRARAWLARRRSASPRIVFVAEFRDAAAGGAGTLKLRRWVRCAGRRAVSKAAGTYRGTFDARGRLALPIRRPAKAGYYFGRLSTAGTTLYRPGPDPAPILLERDGRGAIDWVSPMAFPGC